jgi:hypothetical protein
MSSQKMKTASSTKVNRECPACSRKPAPRQLLYESIAQAATPIIQLSGTWGPAGQTMESGAKVAVDRLAE